MSESQSSSTISSFSNKTQASYINNEIVSGPANAISFVKALHSAKEAQEKFKKTDLETRSEILRRWAELIFETKVELTQAEALDSHLPENFCLAEIIDPAQKYIENLRVEVKLFPKPEVLLPTGIIGILGPRSFGFLFLSKWIANSLAAGNGIIIKPSSAAAGAALRIAEILKRLDLPTGLVQILSGDDSELHSLMAGHPGLNALIYSGPYHPADALIQETGRTKKKAQFFLGAKNSALIHPDFDFKTQMAEILRPALTGMGQLEFNTHRFFISQNVEKEFYDHLRSYLETVKHNLSTYFCSEENKMAYEKAVRRVVPEEGKLLAQGPATFTRDLPNCSDLQQDEVPGPLFIVTAVKYVHEMAKWTNTGYFGHSAIIWGSVDKARNLASQLQVGQVLINKWSDFSDWGLPAKQSFWGNPDMKWSGSFYSDVKKLL